MRLAKRSQYFDYAPVTNFDEDVPEQVMYPSKRSVDTFGGNHPFVGLLGTAGIAGIVIGGATLVLMATVVIALAIQRRSRANINHTSLKQFLLPVNTKPVIAFKTQAGPGGLKNSPSPVQSPSDSQNSARGTPNLQMSPVDSTEALLQEAASTDVKCGTLNFSMRYVVEKNALQVTIKSAVDLPPLPSSTGSNTPILDPYVKLQLLPDKQHKVKTRVVRNTSSPTYDEEFTFYGITAEQLKATTLHFAVVAFDRYSRDEIVGEVICPLHQVDLDDSDKMAEMSMPLISRSCKFQNATNRGELLLSLCYQPATNKVTVVVLKAKNLPKFDVTGLADPYVKVYMMFNGQKVAKKKTHVKKRTLTPVYNESFVFELPSDDPADLDQISFELHVIDWDRVTKNEIMGRCMVGDKARGQTGKSHWEQVRRQPRRQVAEWHRLRP